MALEADGLHNRVYSFAQKFTLIYKFMSNCYLRNYTFQEHK